MDTYKVQMFIRGTAETADELRKELAQVVYDEFQLGSVFDVCIEKRTSVNNSYVMALCMVELEDGLNARQVGKLLAVLPDKGKYMPIEFHANNTSAYGFVDSEYYQMHDYNSDFMAAKVNEVLADMNLEAPTEEYATPDGRLFFMSYFSE